MLDTAKLDSLADNLCRLIRRPVLVPASLQTVSPLINLIKSSFSSLISLRHHQDKIVGGNLPSNKKTLFHRQF